MEKETKLIKKDCLKMSWGMRGGVSYTELLNMSGTEREIIAEIINENLEITKKTKLPYF